MKRLASLGLVLVWLVSGCSAQAAGWPGIATDGNTVFAVNSGNKLLALKPNARLQKLSFPQPGEWEFPAEKDRLPGTYSNPVLADGVLYLTTYQMGGVPFGRLYALDPATGRPLREPYNPGGTANSILASPTVVNGTVYFGSGDHKIYAIDAKTFEKKWDYETRNKVWGSVRVEEGKVFVTSLDHSVYALDERTGALVWDVKTGGPIASGVAYDRGTVYAGSADGVLYALSASGGEKKWAMPTGSWVWNTPLVRNGVLYAGTLGKKLLAIDGATGQLRWSLDTFGNVSAAPLMVGEVLVVGDESGHVYGVEPSTGTKRWDYATDPLQPIQAALTTDGNKIYIMSLNHKVEALNPNQPGIPEWRCDTSNADKLCPP